ncbi:DUF4231 domain-containing protein [Luteimicrobium sp. NPDC057192]|uniref:DUF4231 domain-containing protein n=1 Tax=Luteimicrobium sp. NPDC057192 TaxID=3346042 RepID=UPI00362DB5C1
MTAGAIFTAILTSGAPQYKALYVATPIYIISGLIGVFIIRYQHGEGENFDSPADPRTLEIDLIAERELQSLEFSGERIPLDKRQYFYQGEMLRGVSDIRRNSSRYRRINNAFQSVIIVGSLATTTVASLNNGEGPLKWGSVALSFAVGISAGFMGYFKYRERSFYLQQTADDIEEQMKAFELGLQPYAGMTDQERIAELTQRVEAIRVAQQRREQQLDQPRNSREEN